MKLFKGTLQHWTILLPNWPWNLLQLHLQMVGGKLGVKHYFSSFLCKLFYHLDLLRWVPGHYGGGVLQYGPLQAQPLCLLLCYHYVYKFLNAFLVSHRVLIQLVHSSLAQSIFYTEFGRLWDLRYFHIPKLVQCILGKGGERLHSCVGLAIISNQWGGVYCTSFECVGVILYKHFPRFHS